jgi:hypothetical protein
MANLLDRLDATAAQRAVAPALRFPTVGDVEEVAVHLHRHRAP